MAKPGVASRPRDAAGSGSATRQALIDGAIEALKSEGFAGASARSIAERAGCNQALVFYHFGSVVDLLLAALDDVSARRMSRYREAIAGVESPADLVAVARSIFSEDLDKGFVTVLAQMIAGASTSPGLGAEVASRIAPWRDFAQQALQAGLGDTPAVSLVPPAEMSHAVVALYLGLEMLSQLDGDRHAALSLFDRAVSLAGLLGMLAPPRTSVPKGRGR